jgi:hypothetical protein
MIIFINNGNYVYKYNDYKIILKKLKDNVTIYIHNDLKLKKYKIEINEEELLNDEHFQSIKREYNVLELFGLSNVELLTILLDNSMKKNTYKIEWCRISPLNIKNDIVKFDVVVSPNLELSFVLNFYEYY